jgi:hypothetical protein
MPRANAAHPAIAFKVFLSFVKRKKMILAHCTIIDVGAVFRLIAGRNETKITRQDFLQPWSDK